MEFPRGGELVGVGRESCTCILGADWPREKKLNMVSRPFGGRGVNARMVRCDWR
jgi:hypothetical protein